MGVHMTCDKCGDDMDATDYTACKKCVTPVYIKCAYPACNTTLTISDEYDTEDHYYSANDNKYFCTEHMPHKTVAETMLYSLRADMQQLHAMMVDMQEVLKKQADSGTQWVQEINEALMDMRSRMSQPLLGPSKSPHTLDLQAMDDVKEEGCIFLKDYNLLDWAEQVKYQWDPSAKVFRLKKEDA